jgi:hypothetical protein
MELDLKKNPRLDSKVLSLITLYKKKLNYVFLSDYIIA